MIRPMTPYPSPALGVWTHTRAALAPRLPALTRFVYADGKPAALSRSPAWLGVLHAGLRRSSARHRLKDSLLEKRANPPACFGRNAFVMAANCATANARHERTYDRTMRMCASGAGPGGFRIRRIYCIFQ